MTASKLEGTSSELGTLASKICRASTMQASVSSENGALSDQNPLSTRAEIDAHHCESHVRILAKGSERCQRMTNYVEGRIGQTLKVKHFQATKVPSGSLAARVDLYMTVRLQICRRRLRGSEPSKTVAWGLTASSSPEKELPRPRGESASVEKMWYSLAMALRLPALAEAVG